MSAAFDHPSINTRFVNGERTIGVSDPVNAATAGTYRISRFLNLPHGVYNIKWFSRGASVLRIGSGLADLAVAFTSTNGTLVNTQLYLPGGDVRMDIELAGSASGTDTGVVFLIYNPDRVIYASNAQGWQFDSFAMADAAITAADDPRLALPVWSVLPNWKDGITERIEYLTDDPTSESGAVQTRTLRVAPRRNFEVEFLRAGVRRARLDAFAIGVGRQNFMAPLWHEQYRPPAGIAIGQMSIAFPTDTLALREFRINDLVFVTLGDPSQYELLTVAAIAGDTLTFKTGATREWSPGCRIAPMRRAAITDRSSLSNVTDRVGTMRVRFQLTERDEGFGESWGYCAPLWRFPVNRANAVEVDYDRLSYTFDNETGIPYTINPGDRAIVYTRAQALFKGREATVRLRRFLQAARGRARRFWMPSLTQDLVLATDLGGVSVFVERSGLTEYIKISQSARKMLGFVFADGSPTIYREIISVDRAGDDELLTLDMPVQSIAMRDIERVQFMMPTRFDQDQFELKHHVDESAVVTASFSFKSADIDGMPPITCGVTSWTYPVVAEDEMLFAAGVIGLRYGGVRYEENMDFSADVLGVSYPVNVIYSIYDAGEDEIDFSAGILGASYPVNVIFSDYNIGEDEIDFSAGILGASYPQIVNYLNYDIGEESLDFSPNVLGLTLT